MLSHTAPTLSRCTGFRKRPWFPSLKLVRDYFKALDFCFIFPRTPEHFSKGEIIRRRCQQLSYQLVYRILTLRPFFLTPGRHDGQGQRQVLGRHDAEGGADEATETWRRRRWRHWRQKRRRDDSAAARWDRWKKLFHVLKKILYIFYPILFKSLFFWEINYFSTDLVQYWFEVCDCYCTR